MQVQAIASVRNYNNVNFEGRVKKEKAEKSVTSPVASPMKAVPLAVLLAMSPLTKTNAQNIIPDVDNANKIELVQGNEKIIKQMNVDLGNGDIRTISLIDTDGKKKDFEKVMLSKKGEKSGAQILGTKHFWSLTGDSNTACCGTSISADLVKITYKDNNEIFINSRTLYNALSKLHSSPKNNNAFNVNYEHDMEAFSLKDGQLLKGKNLSPSIAEAKKLNTSRFKQISSYYGNSEVENFSLRAYESPDGYKFITLNNYGGYKFKIAYPEIKVVGLETDHKTIHLNYIQNSAQQQIKDDHYIVHLEDAEGNKYSLVDHGPYHEFSKIQEMAKKIGVFIPETETYTDFVVDTKTGTHIANRESKPLNYNNQVDLENKLGIKTETSQVNNAKQVQGTKANTNKVAQNQIVETKSFKIDDDVTYQVVVMKKPSENGNIEHSIGLKWIAGGHNVAGDDNKVFLINNVTNQKYSFRDDFGYEYGSLNVKELGFKFGDRTLILDDVTEQKKPIFDYLESLLERKDLNLSKQTLKALTPTKFTTYAYLDKISEGIDPMNEYDSFDDLLEGPNLDYAAKVRKNNTSSYMMDKMLGNSDRYGKDVYTVSGEIGNSTYEIKYYDDTHVLSIRRDYGKELKISELNIVNAMIRLHSGHQFTDDNQFGFIVTDDDGIKKTIIDNSLYTYLINVIRDNDMIRNNFDKLSIKSQEKDITIDMHK